MIRNNNTRRGIGRKRGLASAKAWMPRELDADTIKNRALDDARGKVLRSGVYWKDGNEWHWQVRRSLRGRVNQYDFVSNGRIIVTCGARELPKDFRP